MPIRKKTQKMLFFVAESRMTVAESLRNRFMPGAKPPAVDSWIQRRLLDHLMQSVDLFGQRKGYTITNRTCRILKQHGFRVSKAATRPLGAEPKRLYFAFSLYCNPKDRKFKTVYRPSFDEVLFPTLAERCKATHSDPLRQRLFYRDEDTVGLFVLDRGQERFIAHKVRPAVFKLLSPEKYPEMHALALAGRFRLTIATANDVRKQMLSDEFEALKPPFPFEVIELPQLRGFPPRKSKAASPQLF